MTAPEITATLQDYSKYPVPEHIAVEVRDYASRYGRMRLLRDERGLILTAHDLPLAEEVYHSKHLLP